MSRDAGAADRIRGRLMVFSRRDVLAMAGGALAGALAAAGLWPALAQAEDPAVARIKSFYDALQAVTAGPQANDPKARFAALQEPVANAFDLTAMARLAIGPQWSK